MAMTYQQYLQTYRMKPTASAALAWLKSGQAPVGTPIPASLRQHFGGQGSLRPNTPGVDYPESVTGYSPYTLANSPPLTLAPGTFTPPPQAPTPPATDVNPTPTAGDPYTFQTPQNPYLPQMGLIAQQLLGLPALYDPQRRAAAASAASDLAARGLVDFKPGQTDYTTETATTPGVGTVYGVVTGPDGRAYLQAFADIQHGFASRGVGSGSMIDAQQIEARRALDIQRQQILGQSATTQGDLIRQQGGAMGTLAENYQNYATRGAGEIKDVIANWQVPQSFTGQQQAAQVPATVNPNAGRVAGATSAPSPLTQMTGGQRTLTGGLSPVTSKFAGQVGSAVSRVGQSVWSKARTRSTQLTR